MSLQALRIASWPSVAAISSCPVCKETTDEMFQHFIYRKQKMTSRKHLNLEIVHWPDSSKSRFELPHLCVCVTDVGYIPPI